MISYEFTLGGVEFKGTPLDPETSLDVFAIVSPAIGDVLKTIDASKLQGADGLAVATEAVSTVLRTFPALPQTAKRFLKVYATKANGAFLPLEHLRTETFGGKPALHVSWLIAAVLSEYRDFLAPAGWNTLADLGKLFGFQIAFKGTGQSGD